MNETWKQQVARLEYAADNLEKPRYVLITQAIRAALTRLESHAELAKALRDCLGETFKLPANLKIAPHGPILVGQWTAVPTATLDAVRAALALIPAPSVGEKP